MYVFFTTKPSRVIAALMNDTDISHQPVLIKNAGVLEEYYRPSAGKKIKQKLNERVSNSQPSNIKTPIGLFALFLR